VLEMMSARGRGLRSTRNAADEEEKPPGAADASSSLWADFMKEEGVEVATVAAPVPVATTNEASSARKASGKRGSSPVGSGKSVATGGGSEAASSKGSKRSKASPTAGVLVQTGTLDSAAVGRGPIKVKGEPAGTSYHLFVPTVILPSVKIARVFTGCNATHSIALDVNGVPYGWGRNEAGQLGSHLPSNVALPTLLLNAAEGPLASAKVKVRAAALGKSHTLLLTGDGNVWAVGSNKAGQCGIQKAGENVPNFRQCTLPVGITISQVGWNIKFRELRPTLSQAA
jgi:hypothetical protein